jgi:transposase
MLAASRRGLENEDDVRLRYGNCALCGLGHINRDPNSCPQRPHRQPGAHRKDDRQIISGIIHVLKVGCRWQDCPAIYGPPTTIYNRFHRWARKGIWRQLFTAVATADPGDIQMIDSTTAKAHRSAAGGKGGPSSKRSAALAAGERQKSML